MAKAYLEVNDVRRLEKAATYLRDRLYGVVSLEEVSEAFRFDSTLNPHLPV